MAEKPLAIIKDPEATITAIASRTGKTFVIVAVVFNVPKVHTESEAIGIVVVIVSGVAIVSVVFVPIGHLETSKQ